MAVSNRQVIELWVECDGKCFYCDLPLSPRQFEIDHFLPRARGGPDEMWNYVLSCRTCNRAKSDLSPCHFVLRANLGREEGDRVWERDWDEETGVPRGWDPWASNA